MTKHKQPAPPVSEARKSLADLISARDAIVPVLLGLEAQRDRLEAIKPDDSVAGELASLAAKESAEMTAWSVKGEGKPPIANATRRAALNKRLAASTAAAENARAASASIQSQIDAESERYEALAAPIKLAQFQVLIEACEPEIVEFERVNAEAAVRVERIHRLGHLIPEAAHAEVDEKTKADLFALNTAFFGRLDKVDARRRPDDSVGNAAHSAWSTLLTALNSDASATLSAKSPKDDAERIVDIEAIAKTRLEVLARRDGARH
jgi:hypothetical protein